MDFQLSEIRFQSVGYGLAGIIVAALLFSMSRRPNLASIPTVGPSSTLGSLWAEFVCGVNAKKVIQEGYEKHKLSPFKVTAMFRWIVVLRGRQHIDEFLRASEDDLSFSEATNDLFGRNLIFPREPHYHFNVIRSQLTRSLGTMCPTLREEIVTAFNEVLDLKGNEWQSIPALGAAQKIVCRTTNRAFVGLPLCRHPDWVELNINCTVTFFMAGIKLGLLPEFIRPLVINFFMSGMNRSIARGVKLLRATIEERLECLQEYGKEGAEMPSDLLSWLMTEADVPYTVEDMVVLVLSINIAAIHTTSNGFTHALLYLAGHPEYVQTLREEVETVIEKEGWTKVALMKMSKVDSFLKESQRVAANHLVQLMRKTTKDYTFADGTFLPKGTMVGIGVNGVHTDDALYDNALEFEPFRFVNTERADGEGAKHRFVSTGPDYLAFGHGKHACPGRFFATNEMKCLMAHVLLTYDVKLEGDGAIPDPMYFGLFNTADARARVLFRNRTC